jgi:hypothetical protein
MFDTAAVYPERRVAGQMPASLLRVSSAPSSWADKKSSMIGGKRVARDMPFSRDRIPSQCSSDRARVEERRRVESGIGRSSQYFGG